MPPAMPTMAESVDVASAAAAREQGYRPCLRCRPEASPGTPTWLGTSAAVSRGLRLIADGALDRGSVQDLASRLGLDEETAIRAFTIHNAQALKLEHRLGSVEPGKDADLVIFSGDPLDPATTVRLVLVGGRIVHDARVLKGDDR